MRSLVLYFRFIPLIVIFLIGCSEETITYDDPETLSQTEYTFLPEKPTAKNETNLVFYGCSYYFTTSVTNTNNTIEVLKHFNSQLKWPCVLAYDTISLGKLSKGDYNVTLTIIDVNPYVTDTIFFTETKSLTVLNK